MDAPTLAHATFPSMEKGTQADWDAIGASAKAFRAAQADRVLAHLLLLDGDFGGFPIDRLQHSLQTATRAYRANRSDEYVVCALLHDIGDTLGSYNHADIAAAVLKPYVSEEHHWMVEQHAIFQGYYFFHYLGLDRNTRDRFAGHPSYDLTAEFCQDYDQPAFDGSYPTMSLADFEPAVRAVFARPRTSIYLAPSAE